MEEIKFFILIPVYNAERFLGLCLDSILSQNYSDYEVIMVDDGSTDGSGDICDRYAAKDERFHVIHKANGGPFQARLTALEFIQKEREIAGTYSVFVDADDELAKGALVGICEKITASGCDLLIYQCQKIDVNSVPYVMEDEKIEELLVQDMSVLFREAIIEHTYNCLWQKMTRTDMLFSEVDESIKDIRMGEDLLQSLGIYKQNPRTLITPAKFYRYRMHPASITHSYKIERILDDLSAKQYTVSMIWSLNIWDEQDFDRYREKCLSFVARDIRDTLKKCGSSQNAIENLKAIYAHPFVQEFFVPGINEKSSIWLREFEKQHYGRLWLLYKLKQIKTAIFR